MTQPARSMLEKRFVGAFRIASVMMLGIVVFLLASCTETVDAVPEVRIAVVDGRQETQAMAYSVAAALDAAGLDVEIVAGGPSAAYARLARGEADVFFGGYVADRDRLVYETVQDSVQDLGVWLRAGWSLIGSRPDAGDDPNRVGLPVASPVVDGLEKAVAERWPDAEFVHASLAAQLPSRMPTSVDIEVVWLPSAQAASDDVYLLDEAAILPAPSDVHVLANPGFLAANPAFDEWLKTLDVDASMVSDALAALTDAGDDRLEAMEAWLSTDAGMQFEAAVLADLPRSPK